MHKQFINLADCCLWVCIIIFQKSYYLLFYIYNLFCDGCVNYYYYYYFPHHIFDISTPTFVFFEPGLR